MKLSDVPSTDEWHKVLHGSASEHIINVSNFYTMYYLVEVEGVSDIEPEFYSFVSDLRNVYELYGLFAVTKELTSVLNFRTLPKGIRDLPPETAPEIESEEHGLYITVERAIDEGEADPKEIADILLNHLQLDSDGEFVVRSVIQAMSNNPKDTSISGIAHPYETEAFLNGIQQIGEPSSNQQELYDPPDRFVSGAESFFESPNWESRTGYGGDNWAALCRFLSSDYSNVMWVDQSFSIEHNYEIWLDKTPVAGGDVDLLEEGLPRSLPTYPSNDPKGSQLAVVKDVLDLAKEGNIAPVAELAFQTDLHPELERYRPLLV